MKMHHFGLIAAGFLAIGLGEPAYAQTDSDSTDKAPRPATNQPQPDAATLYHADPNHLWNRLFRTLYVRSRTTTDPLTQAHVTQLVGGDVIDFAAWGQTKHWSTPDMTQRLSELLDRFPGDDSDELLADPLRRAMMLRDLWAAYDFLSSQNIRRYGSLETRHRRSAVCLRLARAMQKLALNNREIQALPDNYQAALKSGHFVSKPVFDDSADYLPPGLLKRSDGWVEIDFFQPDLHEDLADRFITLHTRQYRGRSYFRIFYRFPGGRTQLIQYLHLLEETAIDWKQAAQNGFILLKEDAPQIPVKTEVALLQFMMTLNQDLQPVPTKIVESIRHRTFRNVDGGIEPETNTSLGMHVTEYTLKRRLLFDDLRHGGLHREPMDDGQFRVIFQPPDAPDWGRIRDEVLFQQCIDCHMSPQSNRIGVHSMPSIVNMGGFDAGAQLSVAFPLSADEKSSHIRGRRAARWKSRHETYRRLLEQLGR